MILDHFRNPRNHGRLPEGELQMDGVNPVCGDQIHVSARVRGQLLEDIRVEGKGCSISQSSASMMTEALKGRSLEKSGALVADFKRMMLEGASADSLPEALEDLAALEGVKKYPVRIKCALLAWNTLLEGLHVYKKTRE
jgi:nitrogen fixation NifU-like protein